MRTAAVITWFHPAAEAPSLVREALRQCDEVIVVDNTERRVDDLVDHAPVVPPSAAVHVRLGRNTGLAHALNVGVAHVPKAQAVLLLDQDSVLPPGAVAALTEVLTDPGIGIAAATPWDADAQRFLEPGTSASSVLAERDAVITSGMLVRRSVLERVGPFREEFFVDFVDVDFCLRARRDGWRVVQSRQVLLPHRLGEGKWYRVAGLSLRVTRHAEWRLQARARNGTVLLREHWRYRPRWAAREVASLVYAVLGTAAAEPRRGRRLGVLLRGVQEGLRGRPAEAPGARVG